VAITHAIGTKTHEHRSFVEPCRHTAQELVVVFILVGLKIKIAGDLSHARVANPFHIHPHEPVVGVPGNSRGTHGRLLGSRRDLVRMEIVKPQLIEGKRCFGPTFRVRR